MSGRTILGAVGAVVGGYLGGPQGAQYGWMIGSAVGSVADPQVIPGPRVGEIQEQTSQEGGPIPIIFARSPPLTGNVIASGPPVKVKKKKSAGKGGPKVETEAVYRTYAIGVCEGEISRFIRVWRNGQIVYDDSEQVNFHDFDDADLAEYALRKLTNNETFTQRATFYLGTYTQNADPDLEGLFGVGTTPAHRGTAYMVVRDDDLTDMRGAIPQYVFQVEKGLTGESLIIYRTGTHEWQKPAGLLEATVTAIGSGGGACGGGAVDGPGLPIPGGGGGGGGLRTHTFAAADLPDTVAVEVEPRGTGGAGATAPPDDTSGSNGTDGGDSSFGSFLIGRGGSRANFSTGGPGGSHAGSVGTGEAGGAGGNADTANQPGQDEQGHPGASTSASGAGGGGGGPTKSFATPGESGGGGNSGTTLGGASEPGEVGPNATGGSGDGGQSAEPPGGGGGGAGGGCAGSLPNDAGGTATGGDGGDGGDFGGGGGGGGTAQSDTGENATGGDGGDGGEGAVIVQQTFEPAFATLAEVVTAICERAGLPASLIDVSLLTDSLRGFIVTSQYPAREALRALSQVFLFDAAPMDGVLKFIPRGANTVATITQDELLEEEHERERSRRADPIAIPRRLNLNYYDIAGQLNTDKQTSERSGDRRAQGEVQLATAVLFSADEAARIVRITHQVMIEDQTGEEVFQLSDKYIGLTASDCIFLQIDGETRRLRLSKVEILDGYQEYTAVRDRQSSYVSNVQGFPASPQLFPPSQSVGPTILVPLDIHIQRDSDDASGLILYIAVSGVDEGWQGATVELSYDGGANYLESGTIEVSTTVGELVTALPDHPQEYPDTVNTFQVRIDTPDADLEASSLAGMMNRANRAYIGGEIIQFADVDEVSPGVWNISNLLRGRQGTSTEEHGVGSKFVLLDAYATIPMSTTDLNRTLTFRATSYGAPTDTGTVVSINYTGKSQTEREVGYLAGYRDGSNLVVTWQGIGRLGGGASVVHGSRFTGYRVTISDGVLPDVVVDTSEQTITQDVSALGSPLQVIVQQVNALTGAGPSTEVEIT